MSGLLTLNPCRGKSENKSLLRSKLGKASVMNERKFYAYARYAQTLTFRSLK